MNYITWLYFLVENKKGENKKVIFLYGLTLPTKNEKYFDIRIYSKKVDTNKEIVVFSNICETSLSLSNGLLNFDGFIKSEKEALNIINYKKVLQVVSEVNNDIPNSLTGTPIYMKCFYTDEFYRYYDEQNFGNSLIESFIKILKTLEDLSGQKFTLNYSKRLGCYEIGQSQEWIEEKLTPFHVELKGKDEIEYFLRIDKNYIFDEITIHLTIYNNYNEIVRDFIKIIQNNREIFLTKIKEEDNHLIEYWIFDKEGKLIDRNKYAYIQAVVLNANLLDKTYDIDVKNYSNKSPLKDKKRSVSTYTKGFSHSIEFNKIPDIEAKMNNLYQRLKTYKEEDTFYKNGAWFNAGEHEKLIDFLNKITINGAYNITFIDPFISSNASLDYLYHFKNKQISIRFISCWETNISPDDSEEQKETKVSINELQEQLKNIQDFNIPLKTAHWFNFKAKEFHDRFIYIENVSNGEKKVYSISNSLNNMLKKYSLLIIPLKGEVLQKALIYLNELFLECTDEHKIYPKKEL